MHEDINSTLNSKNACCRSVQPSVLPPVVWERKVKICKTIILPVVCYGCETWNLTLREEHGLRVFENRVLRRIFGPKRDELTGERGSCEVGSFKICTHHQILLGRSNQGE
jgi:hypothetical protein